MVRRIVGFDRIYRNDDVQRLVFLVEKRFERKAELKNAYIRAVAADNECIGLLVFVKESPESFLVTAVGRIFFDERIAANAFQLVNYLGFARAFYAVFGERGELRTAFLVAVSECKSGDACFSALGKELCRRFDDAFDAVGMHCALADKAVDNVNERKNGLVLVEIGKLCGSERIYLVRKLIYISGGGRNCVFIKFFHKNNSYNEAAQLWQCAAENYLLLDSSVRGNISYSLLGLAYIGESRLKCALRLGENIVNVLVCGVLHVLCASLSLIEYLNSLSLGSLGYLVIGNDDLCAFLSLADDLFSFLVRNVHDIFSVADNVSCVAYLVGEVKTDIVYTSSHFFNIDSSLFAAERDSSRIIEHIVHHIKNFVNNHFLFPFRMISNGV